MPEDQMDTYRSDFDARYTALTGTNEDLLNEQRANKTESADEFTQTMDALHNTDLLTFADIMLIELCRRGAPGEE